ncbi:endo-1,4-beta-xylanase [Aestuariibaculum suncheonense]|uniref:Beta-xylanase n=1 Tax=Aestuariibaculum suncheonense TaxID=1028745 RepID=A0A8J6QSF7_9FLAO|nr:endo-1,4-beta-xylanase [Aestuariibaculum suncheonense]MBD0835089.1 endo-1,4-beta-xylanase [Aestuariibaculum suncheonense]
MKNIFKIGLCTISACIAFSCADTDRLEFEVEKPESIANQELLNSYLDLKDYVNRETNPNFKLGAGISLSDYINRNVIYRLSNRNFDELTAGYAMKHGAVVQSDGSLNLDNVNEFLTSASESEVSVFGHTLAWHANQKATYLNKLIAPDTLSSTGPGWDTITAADFESDNTSNYEANAAVTVSFTADGEGANGSGRALKVTNAEVRANDWNAQFFLKFSPVVQVGEKYTLTMDVRSDVNATYSTQAHVTPGAYKHWDFFGQIPSTPTWSTYTREIVVSESQATCGAIAFNLGLTATTYYFDNIRLTKYNETGSVQLEDKTPEKKQEIIGAALEDWISQMVTNCAPYVKAWDVVNEPMDDGNPYELKTGVGKTNLASDEFYWQDYLGKDYAVEAFKLARQYGNPDDKLFINDYNLEYSIDKCKGIIEYVKYIESQGQQVDGIGTQMHISINSNKENIATMFQLLAETGKLIKVSELDVRVFVEEPTEEILQQQADMYKYVVEMYEQYIPVNQRYGITVWGLIDSPENASWLPGEHQGLWTLDYTRKPAYTGFADGLEQL